MTLRLFELLGDLPRSQALVGERVDLGLNRLDLWSRAGSRGRGSEGVHAETIAGRGCGGASGRIATLQSLDRPIGVGEELLEPCGLGVELGGEALAEFCRVGHQGFDGFASTVGFLAKVGETFGRGAEHVGGARFVAAHRPQERVDHHDNAESGEDGGQPVGGPGGRLQCGGAGFGVVRGGFLTLERKYRRGFAGLGAHHANPIIGQWFLPSPSGCLRSVMRRWHA